MMPDGALDGIRTHDAIFLGAVGFPGVPDHVSLWGLLIPIRRRFRQYVKLAAGAPDAGRPFAACRSCARRHRLVIVRENNEGEYSAIGGRLNEGTDDEMAMQESVFTRKRVDRIMRYAFEIARSRPKRT